jgi:acyl carrier protein
MDVKKVVSDILSKRIDVSSLKEEDSMSALGLDSLDLVEVMLEIEDALHIEFDSNEIADVATLGDVIKLIETKIK